MNKVAVKEGLSKFNKVDVQNFIDHINKLQTEKKNGAIKNVWSTYLKDDDIINLFKKVNNEGLVFDGKHITLQSTGISYDYIAYKNKMLLVYPNSIIDIQLVYSGDETSFGKDSGKVVYNHKISDPFNRNEDEIIGGYCVIKNARGEFLTTLNKAELDKHRKVAKTDYIWKAWFAEMCLKTVMKKAIKAHFDDIYSNMIETDNQENDLDIPMDLDLEWKKEIDEIETLEELKEYYLKNKGKGKAFDKYVTIRKKDLSSNENADENS